LSSPTLRGLACPINLTPNCFTVDVGVRGSTNAGKLTLGVVVDPVGGVLCGDDGLKLDCCYIQSCQFKNKFTEIFSGAITSVSYTHLTLPTM
jgi:hypothetical protein